MLNNFEFTELSWASRIVSDFPTVEIAEPRSATEECEERVMEARSACEINVVDVLISVFPRLSDVFAFVSAHTDHYLALHTFVSSTTACILRASRTASPQFV